MKSSFQSQWGLKSKHSSQPAPETPAAYFGGASPLFIARTTKVRVVFSRREKIFQNQ